MLRPLTRLFLCLFALILALVPAAAFAAGPDVSQWRVGAPAVRESFRGDDGAWATDSGRNPARVIDSGVLTVRVDDAQQFLWVTTDDEFGDFYLEVDTALLAGPIDNVIGAAFRMQDSNNFYLFAISSDGYFVVGKYVKEKWQPLIDWKAAKAVEAGEGSENRLGLLAQGDQLVVLVNNEELGRVKDSSFTKGQLALLAGSNAEGGVEVAFDNFWLWTKSAIGRKQIGPAPTATPRGGTARGDATVKSATLNVRGGPSTAYPVVATLKQGDTVRIIGRTADSGWAKIDLPGQSQAWVSVSLLEVAIDLSKVAVAAAPAPPPAPKPAANEAYLIIENHIGGEITVQVNDQNFVVKGKVGNTPGTYRFILQGVGRYTVAAQVPGGGSHNWDLYVEPTANLCAGREGCVALGQTFTQTYY